MKIFLESCTERSKLSVDGFWGRWDRIVAQKSNFKMFFFENDVIKRLPPCLPTSVICELIGITKIEFLEGF